MKIPDALILSRIKKRNLYADEKSKELSTQKIKRKYKLAGNTTAILDNYFFHILTTDLDACKRKLTISIQKEHWEEVADGPPDNPYLREDVSYCDLTKYELLGQFDLIQKIRDEENKFSYVARLCLLKCNELNNLCNGRMMGYRYVSDETKSIIATGMLDYADEVLSRLGLD